MDLRPLCCCQLQAFELQSLRINVRNVVCILLLLTSLLSSGISQQSSGFISIDCGGTGGNDSVTGLEWTSDVGFLDSKSALEDAGIAIPASVKLDNPNASFRDNAAQVTTAMAFIPVPSSPSKYCYNLDLRDSPISSTNYLVRAMFPSKTLTREGEEMDLNKYGTRFYFTVDSTFISTIELDAKSHQQIELVVNSIDDFMYICLVPLEDRSSLAAISSIELRPLSASMYERGGSSQSSTVTVGDNAFQRTTYLMTISRLNFGGNEPTLRYPSDIFDRLWSRPKIPQDKSSEINVKRNLTVPYSSQESRWNVSILNEPAGVLRTAWEGSDMSSEISFNYNISTARSYRPLSSFYITLFFLDINRVDISDRRVVDVGLQVTGPNYDLSIPWSSNLSLETLQSWYIYNYKQVFDNDYATFTIKPGENSTLPAMINFAELFGEFEAVTERTAVTDASTINDFVHAFANKSGEALDTAGDPCLPIPWNWLVCSIEIPPRITQINFTTRGAVGELPANFGSLDRLTVLDLSNNSFSGSLPQSLVDVFTLRALNIADNNLSGAIPDFKTKSLRNLETISLRRNQLSGSIDSLVKALDTPLYSLDLSQNYFNGSIPTEIGDLTNLISLNLSNNRLSGNLTHELFTIPTLRTLSLENNMLEGVIPDEIWLTSNQTIINLSDNILTGINLTSWYNYVSASSTSRLGQYKVSLVNNKISNVILPPSHEMQENTSLLNLCSASGVELEPDSFILLQGNPWCQNLEKSNMILVERYLCRSNATVEFCARIDDNGDASNKALIIGLAVTGFIVFLIACVLSVFLWRVYRRMKDLHQIQEALAKDDVRPPFFKYDELKAATKDFGNANELGKGAFGAVYRAELADQSIVAVKLLFPTQQNISDFLKEMVLITGIKHRHLVQLKGCCVRDKKRMLVYEYAENRNLAQALWGHDKTTVLNWEERVKICVGIAKGLSYLHEELQPKIIHRDIKPQNILLDKDWNAKIADFGLARPVDEGSTQRATTIGGTLGYFSPEYATQGLLTEKLDVYSYGILVLEIVAGRPCIDSSAPMEQIYLKDWALKSYKEGSLPMIAEKSLLMTVDGTEIEAVLKTALVCLQVDHEKRPSMSQVVNMLTGNQSADVAMDIVGELKDQQFLHGGLFDSPTTKNATAYREKHEREDRALLASTTYSSSDPEGFIELIVTRGR